MLNHQFNIPCTWMDSETKCQYIIAILLDDCNDESNRDKAYPVRNTTFHLLQIAPGHVYYA